MDQIYCMGIKGTQVSGMGTLTQVQLVLHSRWDMNLQFTSLLTLCWAHVLSIYLRLIHYSNSSTSTSTTSNLSTTGSSVPGIKSVRYTVVKNQHKSLSPGSRQGPNYISIMELACSISTLSQMPLPGLWAGVSK